MLLWSTCFLFPRKNKRLQQTQHNTTNGSTVVGRSDLWSTNRVEEHSFQFQKLRATSSVSVQYSSSMMSSLSSLTARRCLATNSNSNSVAMLSLMRSLAFTATTTTNVSRFVLAAAPFSSEATATVTTTTSAGSTSQSSTTTAATPTTATSPSVSRMCSFFMKIFSTASSFFFQLRVYWTNCTNPYVNLATEDYFFRVGDLNKNKLR